MEEEESPVKTFIVWYGLPYGNGFWAERKAAEVSQLVRIYKRDRADDHIVTVRDVDGKLHVFPARSVVALKISEKTT
jgi:ribosomal protein L18E